MQFNEYNWRQIAELAQQMVATTEVFKDIDGNGGIADGHDVDGYIQRDMRTMEKLLKAVGFARPMISEDKRNEFLALIETIKTAEGWTGQRYTVEAKKLLFFWNTHVPGFDITDNDFYNMSNAPAASVRAIKLCNHILMILGG